MPSLVRPALGALALLASLAGTSAQTPDLTNYVCSHPAYKIHIFSHSPLVIYISDFITPFERDHFQNVTHNTFARSNVAADTGDVVSDVRTSQSTTVPSDAVAQCVAERARKFQGFDTLQSHLEPIQLVKYGVGEQYRYHTDWFHEPTGGSHGAVNRGGNRVSSFFAYVSVSDDVAGGGTNFPRLRAPRDKEWCAFVECDEPWEAGTTFKPVEGNAVFWSNLLADGTGDQRTEHAGLPVSRGSKMGMNIWTKQGTYA